MVEGIPHDKGAPVFKIVNFALPIGAAAEIRNHGNKAAALQLPGAPGGEMDEAHGPQRLNR